MLSHSASSGSRHTGLPARLYRTEVVLGVRLEDSGDAGRPPVPMRNRWLFLISFTKARGRTIGRWNPTSRS